MVEMRRSVAAHIVFESDQWFHGVLQIAVSAMTPAQLDEELIVCRNGHRIDVEEIATAHDGRVHLVNSGPGRYTVDYQATLTGQARPPTVTTSDRVTFLRPSRYAESDRLAATARDEFYAIEGASDLLAAVSSWVGSRLSYVPGSSGPTSGAVDTLLARQGVCRDYAHLVVALLRAMDVPARVAAVYAPGLAPMDFHAVAEALVEERWCVVDATLLAPRAGLIRISTGRDAADTAFLSTYKGAVNLLESAVTAIIDGPLPGDDVTALVSIS